MTNTTYYNLKKPEDSDNVLISNLNGNADAIDQALHGLDEGLKGLKYEPPLIQAGSKGAVADGDSVVITDSADGNKTKRVLWSTVKSALSAIFAAKTHKHSAADISSGALSISRGGTGQTTASLAARALGRGGGTCGTPASTAEKTVSMSGFALSLDAVVSVKFTYGNTAASPSLNINSTGAKPIYNCITGTYIKPGDVEAGMTAFFTYNGTQWVLLNPSSGIKGASGTYIGTGKYGKENKTRLDFAFEPKFLVIGYSSYIAVFARDASMCSVLDSQSSATGYLQRGNTTEWGESYVSWYNEHNSYEQMNSDGYEYNYIAIG